MPAIHTREPALILRAGAQARAHLLEHGLRAGDVDIVPGAAGGPKAVGLAGLDRAVFGDFLPRAPRPGGPAAGGASGRAGVWKSD